MRYDKGMKNISLGLALVSIMALAACGGGGSTPGTGTSVIPQSKTAKVTVSFSASSSTSKSASTSAVHSDFVSNYSSSYDILLNGAPVASGAIGSSNPDCTAPTPPATAYSCSVSFNAPVGSDTFGVVLEDSANQVLSDNQVTDTIVSGSNTVPITLNAVAAKAFVIPGYNVPSTPTVGTPYSSYVQFVDAYTTSGGLQGDVINGPGTFSNGPLYLVETDPTPILTFSSPITSPSSSGQNTFTYTCTGPGTANIEWVTTGGSGPVLGFVYTSANYPVAGTVLWSSTVTCQASGSATIIISKKTK
jgi:hypothetical protein